MQAPTVLRADVRETFEVAGRVDVTFAIGEAVGEALVLLPVGSRDDVEVRTLYGPTVTEWDDWLVEAAQLAWDRERGRWSP